MSKNCGEKIGENASSDVPVKERGGNYDERLLHQILQIYRDGQSQTKCQTALHTCSHFFRLLARIFNNFRQKIPFFDVSRQKRVLFGLALTGSPCGSLWLLMALSLPLSGSLWLSVTPTLAPTGSNLLSQAFTGSLWLLLDLSLSLSSSLWLSVTPTLALNGSHCHSLAYSGPLWLTIAL